MVELPADIEQTLSALSDTEFDAFTARIRAPKEPPAASGAPLANERREPDPRNPFPNSPGMAEAFKRGYIDADGKPVKGARP